MMECIDLRHLFGADYKISWDEAYDAKGKHRDSLDPWYALIPCRFGVIYPHGGNRLAVEVDRHPKATKLLLALPGLTPTQSGDDEMTFVFEVGLFAQVAAVVQPRRRRRLSEARRHACAEQLAKVRPRFPA
jgi:hypothetical protein